MISRPVIFFLILLVAAINGCSSVPDRSPVEQQDFSQVVDEVQPAVVTIRTFDVQTRNDTDRGGRGRLVRHSSF